MGRRPYQPRIAICVSVTFRSRDMWRSMNHKNPAGGMLGGPIPPTGRAEPARSAAVSCGHWDADLNDRIGMGELPILSQNHLNPCLTRWPDAGSIIRLL